MRRWLILLLPMAAGVQEPGPRPLRGRAIPLSGRWETISGVRELRDGRLLVSDATAAAVYLVDVAKKTQVRVGHVGGDSLDYAQPGGFYNGVGDTILMLDRGLTKVLLFSSTGTVVGSRSIKQNGVSGSSTEDIDRQRVDSRGYAYFATAGRPSTPRAGQLMRDSSMLQRFDPVRQRSETVAWLRLPSGRVTQSSGNFVMARGIYGSPSDQWGVTSDGSVAVVRGSPYRVDWYSPSGALTRGPEYDVPKQGYSSAEKDSITAALAGGGVSVGVSGGGATVDSDHTPREFAETKPAFDRNAVSVSPGGQVWVSRVGAPRGATVFDVFDRTGQRTDRVVVPVVGHIVGFGRASIYLMGTTNGTPTLTRVGVTPR